MLLDLSACPSDPVEKIVWLDTVLAAVADELEPVYERAYFDARLQGRLGAAIEVGRASRKRALALTRRHNNASGRQVRWNDGADPSSTNWSI